ncbi:MAG: hypothetical protein AB1566_15680, partial [Chloroflexota bacterium]
LGEHIEFLGYSLEKDEVASGDILQVILFWRASERIDREYVTFLHVLDDQGHTVGQQDAPPDGGARPTTSWVAGEIVADRKATLIQPGTLPGRYNLEVGMYEAASLTRLPVNEAGKAQATSLWLEPIQVMAPRYLVSADTMWIQHQLEKALAPGVELLGYDVVPEVYGPKEQVNLSVYVRSPRRAVGVISLVDERGRALEARGVTFGLAPDGIFRYYLRFPVFLYTPSGRYHFRLGLAEAGVEPVNFGQVIVKGTQPLPKAGAPSHPMRARLGGDFMFLGYDLHTPEGIDAQQLRPGEAIYLDLYWQALRKSDRRYTVFTHLLGGSVNPASRSPIWGQHDGEPLSGGYPTTQWLIGPVILDRHELTVDASAPSGLYELEAGMYLADTGERLPVFDLSGNSLGDRLLLGKLRVVPP